MELPNVKVLCTQRDKHNHESVTCYTRSTVASRNVVGVPRRRHRRRWRLPMVQMCRAQLTYLLLWWILKQTICMQISIIEISDENEKKKKKWKMQ